MNGRLKARMIWINTENYFCFLHHSLQYLTSFQTFSHFFRHENGRPQTGQVFTGKFCFLTRLGITETHFYYQKCC